MSDLEAHLRRLNERQEQNLNRAILTVVEDEIEDIDLSELDGFDAAFVMLNGDAVIVEVTWGDLGIAVEATAFIEGDRVSGSVVELEGTTSVMAVRP